MKKVIPFLLAISLTSCVYRTIDQSNPFDPEPKIGDVWRWTTTDGNNPFETHSMLKPYYDYKVLDLKNGYVQYMDLSDSSIESSTIRMFKVGAERISN